MRLIRRTALAQLLLASSIARLTAQTIDTGILGTVSDSTRAVVPQATVTITQRETGFARTVTASAEGAYELRYLLPGEYSVEVRAGGFRTERQNGVLIQIGQQARINFVLQVGAVDERIDVTA